MCVCVCVCVCMCSVTGNLSVCQSLKCLGRLRRFGLRIPGKVRELYSYLPRNAQPASSSHSAFHSVGTGFCPSGKPEEGALRMSGAIPLLSLYVFIERAVTFLNLLL